MNRSVKFWDRIAKNYNNPVEPDTEIYRAVEITRNYLKHSDIALDYGCATGTITAEIAKHVHTIHAIDISANMIELATSNASVRQLENIHFAHTTIVDERYQPDSFDVILAFNILHLLDDAQSAVHRINELLKPGGLFISTTACMGEKQAALSIFLSALSKIGLVPYLNMLKISELEDLIVSGNFQMVETETLNPNPVNYFVVARKR